MDNKGGDVFLSTFLNMGCGGGYYGAQMHWNTMQMSVDWAVWDSGEMNACGRGERYEPCGHARGRG